MALSLIFLSCQYEHSLVDAHPRAQFAQQIQSYRSWTSARNRCQQSGDRSSQFCVDVYPAVPRIQFYANSDQYPEINAGESGTITITCHQAV